MQGTKQRITEIDMLRGITILLVIFAHVDAPAYINSVLSIFRMPLFFLVTGYLFSASRYMFNFTALVKTRLLTLVLPYFSACMLSYIYWILTNTVFGQYKDNNVTWYKPIIGFLNGNFGEILNYPLWFLTCLFCSQILFCLFLRIVNNFRVYTQIALFVLIGVLGFLIGKVINLPWGLDIAIVAQFFLFMGYIVKEYKLIEKAKIFNLFTLCITLIFALSIITNNTISMGSRDYGNILLFYTGGIAGSILVFTITKLFVRYKLVVNVLSYLGRESLSILIFHVGIAFIILGYIDHLLLPNMNLHWTIYMVCGVLISLLVGVVIRKIPILNLLFNGKKMVSKTGKGAISKNSLSLQ